MSLTLHPRVLVVGSGAREHAVVWKLAQSPRDPVLYAAPGNPGINQLATCVPIAVSDVAAIVRFAKAEAIQLVVVGPEQPLADGLVDACEAEGIAVFGPTQACAQLESSKAFAKALMMEANVPTARSQVFTDAESAKAYVQSEGAPIVVKADGLAAGKGVVVAETVHEAIAAIDDMLDGGRFGDAGERVVVESFLVGEEASVMYFVDGSGYVPMIPARDHKRIGEGNTGPNTGGMGAFAPITAPTDFIDSVSRRIVEPTLAELANRGLTYRGVLYVGLMMTESGPFVVEFNARFGDPETQVVLPLLSTDLLDILWAVAYDGLSKIDVAWHDDTAVCVVLAAKGYPAAPRTGDVIEIAHMLENSQNPVLFHAGTRLDSEDRLCTAGGRVIAISARGRNTDQARQIAYQAAEAIYFDGKSLRRDIGLPQGG
jgi:phosphoribosylamine---glycine ligase